MSLVTILRALIIVEIVCGLLAIYADVALASTLPLELQAYLVSQSQAGFGAMEMLKTVVLIAFFVTGIVAAVALWFLKRWARPLYTILVVISLVLTLFLGPVVMSAAAEALSAISTTASGVILGLLWFSELRQHFQPTPPLSRQ